MINSCIYTTTVKSIHSYLVWIGLFFYGFFYHISSSEFWPVAISKTWFTPSQFENSLLQKPLFSLVLSFLHLFPLADSTHILIVKTIFSLIGIFALWTYSKVVLASSGIHLSRFNTSFVMILLLTIAPVLLTNYFRVRADQLGFFIFILFLYCHQNKKILTSLFLLILIPLISIKSFIFLLLSLLILFLDFKIYFTQLKLKHKIFSIGVLFLVVIWVLNFNFEAIHYLLNTYKNNAFPNPYLKDFVFSEAIPLLAAFLCYAYSFFKKDAQLKKYSYLGMFSFFLIILMPQAYPYYIASLAPICYLVLIVYLVKYIYLKFQNEYLKSGLIFFLSLYVMFIGVQSFNSSKYQIEYLKSASQLLSTYKLTYLDGMGILPKQSLKPCFISPDDELANTTCLIFIKESLPDVVILTQRLSYLGMQVFDELNKNYVQIKINTWLRKDLQNKLNIDVNLNNLAPPMFIFDFK